MYLCIYIYTCIYVSLCVYVCVCLHGLVEFGRTLGLLSISAMETIEGEGRLSRFSLPQFVHLYNGNNVSTPHGG